MSGRRGAGSKRPEQIREMGEAAIRLHIEPFAEGSCVAGSRDVPGPVAQGRSIMEAAEIAQAQTRKLSPALSAETPTLSFVKLCQPPLDLLIPVSVG